jgi:hypothetical protein
MDNVIPKEFLDRAEVIAVRFFSFTEGKRTISLVNSKGVYRLYETDGTEDWKKKLAYLLHAKSELKEPMEVYQTLDNEEKKFLLIECKTKDEHTLYEVRNRIMELTSIIDMYPTKMGADFIVEPCETDSFEYKDINVLKNALMLLTY